MADLKNSMYAVLISLVVLGLVFSPYIIGFQSGGESYVFSGFLLNPLDGNSYLAKMYQGWDGNWRFHLPFTAEPGEGAYLFLFYLGLGHLARVVDLPLVVVYHLARGMGAVFLLVSMWAFFGQLFQDERSRRLAFALASLGSGMGWLLVPFGAFTSDFWVAETYPFLSMYANPHFPIGLALVLLLVKPGFEKTNKRRTGIYEAAVAFFLSVVNPFGVVVSLMALGCFSVWLIYRKAPFEPVVKRALIVAGAGLPTLIYDIWVANTDPVFRTWNMQNLTPSPPVWDLIFSLSPALLLGGLGVFFGLKKNKIQGNSRISLLILWAGFGLLSLYLPFGLQRRFMMGLFVPMAGLAALGIKYLGDMKRERYRILTFSLFLLSLPTNLIILLAAQSGIDSRDSKIFLTKGESRALSWIEANTDRDALILSSPEMGLFIPAYTGRRVIYGHPFETAYAQLEEEVVLGFYQGRAPEEDRTAFLQDREIDVLFYGPRERAIGGLNLTPAYEPVFIEGDVILFQIRP